MRWISALTCALLWAPRAWPATAIYTLTKQGALYRSTDSAKTWQQVSVNDLTPTPYNFGSLAIDPQNPRNMYLAVVAAPVGGKGRASGTTPTLFRSGDGGQSWSEVPLFPSGIGPKRLWVDPGSATTLYAYSGSVLYRSTDSGTTFSQVGLGVSITAIASDPGQAGVLYAFGITRTASAPVNRSADFGATWGSVGSIPLPNVLSNVRSIAIDPHDSKTMFASLSGCTGTTSGCGLRHSADGGKTWDTISVAGDFSNIAIDPRSGAIYAAGTITTGSKTTGHVAKSADGGKTWTSLDTGLPVYDVHLYLDPNAPSTLYAAPDQNNTYPVPNPAGILVSTNGGAWTLSPIFPQAGQSDLPLDVQVASGSADLPAPPASTVTVSQIVSAAGGQAGPVAPESIVIATGSHIATDAATADPDQPATTLTGTSINVTDSAGVTRPAVIFSVSPTQVTYQIPPGTAAGPATVTITAGDGVTGSAQVQVAPVAPGLYTLTPDGLVKAYVVRVSNGNMFVEEVSDIDATGAVIARPITISNGDQVYLIAYGTGFRAAGGDIGVTVGGEIAPVLYAGPQGVQPGIDQFNILIPPDLGTGTPQTVQIQLTAGGQAANAVKVAVQ